MNLSRIQTAIDTDKTQRAKVAVIGGGGSAGFILDLARCGVRHFVIYDPDRVEASNVARQAHGHHSIGRAKVDAVADLVLAVNPDAEILALPVDFTAVTDVEIDATLGDVDLLIFATDRFRAQARGNQVALRLSKPALWIGLYRGGRAGELIFWHPALTSCFRCLCAARYRRHDEAEANGIALDPPSDGATIFDIHYLDALAGHVAVGLLTQGSPNRYGQLIGQLADRNFLQVKIDPTWTWNGRDIIREQLGIGENCGAYVGFVTIGRSDPDRGQPPCPDCVLYRGRRPAQGVEAIPDGCIP